jgi:hypothetical protein
VTAAVAFVTPTKDRADRHEALYATFVSQTIEDKRLYVLDESDGPSPFFSHCDDERVHYVHKPNGPRGEISTIGSSRNRLNAMTTEPVLLHLDDDDWVHETYGETMLAKLGDHDLCKLSRWRALLESDGTVWEWDSTKMGGTHYAIKGGEPVTRVQVEESDPVVLDGSIWGYGFSFCYKRSLWERVKFPEEGTEDYPWILKCREAGAKMKLVDDCAHLVLHAIHDGSKIAIYPQKKIETLGAFDGGIRMHVGATMLGALSDMKELHRGKKVSLEPGVTYSALATVDKKHSIKDLTARCSTYGVHVVNARDNVDHAEFDVDKPPGDHRLVHVTAKATKKTTMPWGVPSPLNVFDSTSLLRVWTGSDSQANQINAQLVPASGVAGFVRKVRPRVDYQINHQLSPRSP